jgi:hypothetical protein
MMLKGYVRLSPCYELHMRRKCYEANYRIAVRSEPLSTVAPEPAHWMSMKNWRNGKRLSCKAYPCVHLSIRDPARVTLGLKPIEKKRTSALGQSMSWKSEQSQISKQSDYQIHLRHLTMSTVMNYHFSKLLTSNDLNCNRRNVQGMCKKEVKKVKLRKFI